MIPTLEQHRSFSMVAWIAIVIFSGLVIWLAVKLDAEMTTLASDRDDTVSALKERAR